MTTQKRIDARDALIKFLFDDLVDEISKDEADKYRELKESIADADKEAAGMKDEMLDALIELYDRCDNKNAYPDIKAIIERATGMTIDEAIKAYEEQL